MDWNLKTWWKVWGDLVLRLATLAGCFLSLVPLLTQVVDSQNHLTWWAKALLAVAGLFLLVFIVLEFASYRRRRVYAKSDSKGIKDYMHRWINHGGRVAIWTRDLSWAHSADTRKLLQEKASKGELILCLPEPNDLSNQLSAAGAEICAYGSDLLESPASRFTIIFFGRDGQQVAVGRAQGDLHVIDEFTAGSHPAFYLAEDLVSLVRARCRKGSTK